MLILMGAATIVITFILALFIMGVLENLRQRGMLNKVFQIEKIKHGPVQYIDGFISKANIRKHIPFFSSPILILICIILFLVSSFNIYKFTRYVPSAFVLGSLIAAVPFFALDYMARYNAEKIRMKLAGFISVLNRWCLVKEDIFYAFEKSVDSGIGEPLATYINETVIQVNRGVDPSIALNMLQGKVDNHQFRDFIQNIKQNVKHRGNIVMLLNNLEIQFYKVEEEYNRRKISGYKDKILIYFIMVAVWIIGFIFLKINTQVEHFYTTTTTGKLLFTLFSVLYTSGAYFALKNTSFH